MFRLYYECGIDAKYVTPKHQKKSGAWRIIIACIKEDQEWGTVSWFLSFAHSYFKLPYQLSF